MNISKKLLRTIWDILKLLDTKEITIFEAADSYGDILKLFAKNTISEDDRSFAEMLDIKESVKDIVDAVSGEFSDKGILYIVTMIFNLSQVYVPVDTGRLRDSGRIEKTEDSYRIVYETPYAIYVHEVMENTHKAPTRAKFLEDAAYEVLNYSLTDDDVPLFTFSVYGDDYGNLILEINSLDVKEFLANKKKRDAIHDLDWIDLDLEADNG